MNAKSGGALREGRPYTRWRLIPPFQNFSLWPIDNPEEIVWHELRQLAELSGSADELFDAGPARRRQLHEEFGSLIRQARTYADAAAHVRGSSAALLKYYAALGLAKAELLRTYPDPVFRASIRHGLSYNPATARKLTGDSIRVAKGVFPLLFEARTGNTISHGTELRIRELLRACPEITHEFSSAGFGKSDSGLLLHAVVARDNKAWSVIAIDDWEVVATHKATGQLFRKYFREIQPHPAWRDHFELTRRMVGITWHFFESKNTVPAPNTEIAMDIAHSTTAKQLAPIVDVPTVPWVDALISPSLKRTKMFEMPTSLVRYALMFYVSSLVRYRPSFLDPRISPVHGWVLDAFTDESWRSLLIDALSGISQMPVVFVSSAHVRT